MPNPSMVTVTHSMVILDQSNTVYTVQGSDVRLTFIGGSNDVANFLPQSANDKVIAINTNNFTLGASDATNLQAFVAGAVVGMEIGGWGNFDIGTPKLFLIGEGHYKVAIDNFLDTGSISGLNGRGFSHNGSISFFDSPLLAASQIVGIPTA
jgi:hypothetical protein